MSNVVYVNFLSNLHSHCHDLYLHLIKSRASKIIKKKNTDVCSQMYASGKYMMH